MTIKTKEKNIIKKQNNSNNIDIKEYKTIKEHVDYLEHKKKIIVQNNEMSAFEERNYASIINPYKEFFAIGRDINNKHIYNKTTQFNEIKKLIQIDDEFSTLLYTYIGFFEKHFKTVLFEEMCKKYALNSKNDEDKNCTSYLREIKNLETSTDIPKFCPHLNSYLARDKKTGKIKYVAVVKQQKDYRKKILKKIENIGNAKDSKNTLILHYKKTLKAVPLWGVANELSLGEYNTLFNMLDNKSKKNIISKFEPTKSPQNLTNKKIMQFSGRLEEIRKLRNVVNHYEPVFPYLLSKKQDYNQFNQIEKVLEILVDNYQNSYFKNTGKISMNIIENKFNEKHVEVLNLMKNKINESKK